MNIVVRIGVTLLSSLAALYFVFWFAIPPAFLLHASLWMSSLVSLLAAAGMAWYVWTHTASFPTSLASSVFLGTCAVGGIGFAAGFFGPFLFQPSGMANAGPLLGLLAGALGCILGAVGGALHWYAREGRVDGTSNGPKSG